MHSVGDVLLKTALG